MNLVDKFVKQPISIKFSIFWVLIVIVILAITEPWLILFFFFGWGTVIAIGNLIIYFAIR